MAKVRVKTLNFTRLKKKLLQAPIELRREVSGLLATGAAAVEADVKRDIEHGTKTGRMYVRKGVKYRASAPGQAPAYATGSLFRTIKTKVSNAAKPNAKLVADGVYRLMEFGTRLMAARPAFLPAWQRHKAPIARKVETESKNIFRKFKV